MNDEAEPSSCCLLYRVLKLLKDVRKELKEIRELLKDVKEDTDNILLIVEMDG